MFCGRPPLGIARQKIIIRLFTGPHSSQARAAAAHKMPGLNGKQPGTRNCLSKAARVLKNILRRDSKNRCISTTTKRRKKKQHMIQTKWHLVRDVRIYPLVLLHRVAHGDVEPGPGRGGGGAPSRHVHVGQNIGVRCAVRHRDCCPRFRRRIAGIGRFSLPLVVKNTGAAGEGVGRQGSSGGQRPWCACIIRYTPAVGGSGARIWRVTLSSLEGVVFSCSQIPRQLNGSILEALRRGQSEQVYQHLCSSLWSMLSPSHRPHRVSCRVSGNNSAL